MNVLKCILVKNVGFLKYKSGLLHGHKMRMEGCFFNMRLCNFGTLFWSVCWHVHPLRFGNVPVFAAVQFVYVLPYVVVLGPGSLWLLLISRFLLIPHIVLQLLSPKR